VSPGPKSLNTIMLPRAANAKAAQLRMRRIFFMGFLAPVVRVFVETRNPPSVARTCESRWPGVCGRDDYHVKHNYSDYCRCRIPSNTARLIAEAEPHFVASICLMRTPVSSDIYQS